jgi:uncharacterized protein DUF3551
MLQTHVHLREAASARPPARVRTFARSRAAAVAVAIAAAIVMTGGLFAAPAQAAEYAWCTAQDSDLRCDYVSQQQCMAAGSGTGASCLQNPRLLAQGLLAQGLLAQGLSAQAPARGAYARMK